MASETIQILDASGNTVAVSVDDLGALGFIQRSKLAFGADGAADDVTAANPLPVGDAAGLAKLEALRLLLAGASYYPATQPVSASALPLPAGAASDTTLQAVRDRLPATAHSQPLTDTQLRAAAVPVSGTFWQATQPVSAAALPLPSGASTSALQTTGNTSLASIDGKTPALASGRVPVDGSGVTQPVSVSSLPLPSGAATETKLEAIRALLAAPVTPVGASTETTLGAVLSALLEGNAGNIAAFRGIFNLLASPRGYDKALRRLRVTAAIESGTVTTVTTVSNISQLGGQDAAARYVRPQNRISWVLNHRSRIT